VANATDLMVRLYGHDVSASKALKDVGKEAETVSGKLKHIGKMGAVGFGAVAGAALEFAREGVKAAIHVEKQQKQLDIAIRNNTKSTKEQAKGANEYLEKLRLTYGVSNEKLIPAYSKLVRSTKDLGESQKLLNLALNISSGTGKDLGSVTVALSKAYNGNYAGLTRLGVPIDKATLKTKDFNKITGVLAKTFDGSAKASTETFAGKMAILHQNLDAAKEKIGVALLPILTKMADYIVQHVVPNIQAFVDGLTGKDSVDDAAGKATQGMHDFGEKVRDVVKFIVDHKNVFENLAKVIGAVFVGSKAYSAAKVMVSALGLLKTTFAETTLVAATTAEAEAAATGGGSVLAATPAMIALAAFFGTAMWAFKGDGKATKTQIAQGKAAAITGAEQQKHGVGAGAYGGVATNLSNTYDYYGARYTWDAKNKTWRNPAGIAVSAPPGAPTHHASGGAVAAGTQIMVGENGPELFTPTSGGSITPHNLVGGSGMNIVIHVAGSVIHEKDLAVTVRDNIAQLMRRRGLNPAILGV
jgi:hypothetical protein